MATQEVTLGQLAGWFNRLGDKIGQLDFTKPLKSCAVAASASIKENFAGSHDSDGKPWSPLRFPRPMGGDKPLQNFGILRASATSAGQKHVERISDRALEFGTNLESARLHQEGGTVVPRRAKALTIPLTKEAFRSGGARNMPGLFIWRPEDSDKAFLVEQKQKGKGKKSKAQLIFHWLLAKMVRVPARPFMGISPKLAQTWDDIMARFVTKELGEGPIR